MSKIFKICISDKNENKMINVNSVEAVSGKGILNDRYYGENNSQDTQITLIESDSLVILNVICILYRLKAKL